MKTVKKWRGTWPAKCDICEKDLEEQEIFIDGVTQYGPWALMCQECHSCVGNGIGSGRGQAYSSATLLKLEG